MTRLANLANLGSTSLNDCPISLQLLGRGHLRQNRPTGEEVLMRDHPYCIVHMRDRFDIVDFVVRYADLLSEIEDALAKANLPLATHALHHMGTFGL